jgi:hypothetical protein
VLLRRYNEFLRTAEVINSAQTPNSATLLRAKLDKAQRFVFTEAAALACLQLADHPDQLRRAQAQIFSPFPECWIEFPSSLTSGGARVSEGFMWLGSDDGVEGLRSGGLIHIGWPQAREFPMIVPFQVDLSQPNPVSVSKHMAAMVNDAKGTYLEAAVPTLDEMTGAIPDAVRWILAAWALLATKGMTTSVTPDMSRLNRSRGQRGLYPLLTYTEIRLNLDAERAVKAKAAAGTGNMPLHPVRAHLRLLPTGRVTIVSAHMRGNPDHGVRSHHYTVLRAEDGI